MDDAARVRVASREAIAEITPPALADLLDTRICDGSLVAGVLTRLAADAGEVSLSPAAVDKRSAGVQLIYEGLTLTRTLARSQTWGTDEGANLEVLAADVLVARGFYLLARTEAAGKAVETVRSFGRDEANRNAGESLPEQTLEADIFELAIIAGLDTTDPELIDEISGFAVELARSLDDKPIAQEVLSEPAVDALAELATDGGSPPQQASHIWAGSSSTDP